MFLPRPSGVYAETYAEDIAWVRTRSEWLMLAALVIIPFALPLLLGKHMLGLLISIVISMISVLGLYVTTGMAGQINLGQAAFMGVGAYCTALAARQGLPSLLAILTGGIGSALFGAVFGAPALRIKGYYLALSTVAAQFVFEVGVVRLPSGLFGGTQGLSLPPLRIAGRALTSDEGLYIVFLVISMVMLYGCYNLQRSRFGRALISLRDNDVVARCLGVNASYYKIQAFMLGAFYAGIAGGLWAYYTRFVTPEQFTLIGSIWYVGMLVVGGIHTVLGTILGTIVVRTIEYMITTGGSQLAILFPQLGSQGWFALMNILLGGCIILALLFEPRGLAHRWNILRASHALWPFPHGR